MVTRVAVVFRIFHIYVVNIFSDAPAYRTVKVIRLAESFPLSGGEHDEDIPYKELFVYVQSGEL